VLSAFVSPVHLPEVFKPAAGQENMFNRLVTLAALAHGTAYVRDLSAVKELP
jgi:hypothetical protein